MAQKTNPGKTVFLLIFLAMTPVPGWACCVTVNSGSCQYCGNDRQECSKKIEEAEVAYKHLGCSRMTGKCQPKPQYGEIQCAAEGGGGGAGSGGGGGDITGGMGAAAVKGIEGAKKGFESIKKEVQGKTDAYLRDWEQKKAESKMEALREDCQANEAQLNKESKESDQKIEALLRLKPEAADDKDIQALDRQIKALDLKLKNLQASRPSPSPGNEQVYRKHCLAMVSYLKAKAGKVKKKINLLGGEAKPDLGDLGQRLQEAKRLLREIEKGNEKLAGLGAR